VSPYENETYLVIEGNRRVAACKLIDAEASHGTPYSDEILGQVRELPVVIAEGTEEELFALQASLMGIRHVSGIKPWGGYQSAKLIADMRDRLGLSNQQVAQRLGLTVREALRRYKVFQALEQLRTDDTYGDLFDADKYPLFDEAIKVRPVREWLGWQDDTMRFGSIEELGDFYRLIFGETTDDGVAHLPKLTNYNQIRELRRILPHEEAKDALLNGDLPFQQCLAIALRNPEDHRRRRWVDPVRQATLALQDIPADELAELDPGDLMLIQTLIQVARRKVEQHTALADGGGAVAG
jgi:hypothetical protein